jgi:hypothetical protein
MSYKDESSWLSVHATKYMNIYQQRKHDHIKCVRVCEYTICTFRNCYQLLFWINDNDDDDDDLCPQVAGETICGQWSSSVL